MLCRSLAFVLLAVAASDVAAEPIGVDVRANGRCPSSAAVIEELGRIAALSEETASARAQVEVFATADRLRVRLGDASGRAVDERVVAAGADCNERALAAAVVIAAWQTDLRSGVRLGLGSARPAWSPSAGVAGVGLASGTGGWGWGGALELQLAHHSGWGGRMSAWGSSYRTQGLGTNSGKASWTRWALGVGPVFEVDRDRWIVTVAAELVVARFAVRGEDLAWNRQDAAVDVGARLGIEAGFGRGRLVPWAGIALVGWPRAHRVKALGVDAEQTLPKLDVLLAAGLRWGRRP